MKPVCMLLVLGLAVCSSSPADGDETSAPLKVLFIGNSYTAVNDLPAIVESLAEAAGGRRIETGRHLVGGATLERHVKKTRAVDKIREKKWDVVVLQEQSLRPIIQRERMWQFARLLHAEIAKQDAETVFYLTWARQHITAMQAGSSEAEYQESMFTLSRSGESIEYETWCKQNEPGLREGLNGAYLGIAEELKATVAPVGVAWQRALKANTNRVLHHPDKSHPNRAGSYLAACVFYATLLRETPVGLPRRARIGNKLLVDLSADEARMLQTIAWDAVRQKLTD